MSVIEGYYRKQINLGKRHNQITDLSGKSLFTSNPSKKIELELILSAASLDM